MSYNEKPYTYLTYLLLSEADLCWTRHPSACLSYHHNRSAHGEGYGKV
jgi:hypothetical protein